MDTRNLSIIISLKIIENGLTPMLKETDLSSKI